MVWSIWSRFHLTTVADAPADGTTSESQAAGEANNGQRRPRRSSPDRIQQRQIERRQVQFSSAPAAVEGHRTVRQANVTEYHRGGCLRMLASDLLITAAASASIELPRPPLAVLPGAKALQKIVAADVGATRMYLSAHAVTFRCRHRCPMRRTIAGVDQIELNWR